MGELREFWKKYRRNRLAVAGFLVILLMVLVALTCGLYSPYPPDRQDLSFEGVPQPPGGAHLFGTDNYGRDVFSRALYGTRISLLVGILAVSLYMLIGILLGSFAGYYGGWVDGLIMRVVDVMLSIPTFFFILAIQVLLSPSVFNVIVVIGLTSWAGPTRLVRGQVLALKETAFIEAARACGASDSHIIFRHIIPNCLAPVIVMATLGVAGAILTESVLSFLGLGVQEPQASWGNMLMRAQEYISTAPWMALYPGVLIMLTVLSFNFMGEGIRDAVDPKMKLQ
ncbi:MAG: ABC transporter permease [Candidatus Eremiobacteraeota bacterium]|nr:ABC transporter permease [Candidatus Eremiobacteraeota bacterium]